MASLVIIGRGEISFAFTDSESQNPGVLQSVWTFTNKASGSAAADRYGLVSVLNQSTAPAFNITVTVGGISATDVLDGRFWLALVPTGTTATIVVTFPGNINFCGIGVYSITGQLNTTPFHTQNTQL